MILFVMRIDRLVPIIFILLVLATAAMASRDSGTMRLSANPSIIVADGKSSCTVVSQVRQSDGSAAPDGTEIRFTASLGQIEEVGYTSAGTARVKLISGEITGDSIITASWIEGRAVAQTSVSFCEAGAVMDTHPYIQIKSDEYLAYAVQEKVLEAIGNVHVRFKSLDLTAGRVQIDLEKHRIIAKSGGANLPVVVKTPSGELKGNNFLCEFSGSAMLVSAVDGTVKQFDFTKAASPVDGNPTAYPPEDFELVDLFESVILIKAREAVVFPDDKIQFKQTNVYVAGKRSFSLPLYMLSLNGFGVDGEQYIGLGTGGIVVNLPLYYYLSPTSNGAFLIRRGVSTGWGYYDPTPRWFMDVRQKYTTDHSQGVVELNRVVGGNLGAQLSHNQQFGRSTSTFLYMDCQSQDDLYGNFNIDHSFTKFSAGINLSGNKLSSGSNGVSGDLHIRQTPKQIGHSIFKYNLSAQLGYSRSETGDTADADTTSTTKIIDGFSKSLQCNLTTNAVPLTKTLSLVSSAGLGYLWSDTSASTGMSSQASSRLNWNFSRFSNMQLGYNYARRASIYTSTTNTGTQSLTLSYRVSDPKQMWYATFYGIQGLDYTATNLFANFDYNFAPMWRFGVRTTMNKFASTSYNDLEFELARKIGDQEAVVVWSQSNGKIIVEFGASSF